MSSRSSSRLASPWWVALDAGGGAERTPSRERPALVPVGGERASAAAAARPAPRLERAARRGSEPGVGVLLLVLWVTLWAVFTAGVVLPAAAVHGGGAPARLAPIAAPG